MSAVYKHVDPKLGDLARHALAPYNFVPLPVAVLPAEHDAMKAAREEHDRYNPERESGWIEVEIEAKTPVFIRGAVPEPKGRDPWSTKEARLRPDPATTPDGRPMLPGSSLRGMVRTLVEILSSSRMTFVNDERPFFRTVADDRIGRHYRKLLVADERAPPRAGRARKKHGGGWEIEVAQDVLRVEHRHIRGLEYKQHPNYHPEWALQHRDCWFRREEKKRYRVGQLVMGEAPPAGEGWEAGVLVLTGSAPRKKREFVFVFVPGAGKVVPIPDAVLERFHSEDQVSPWQERAFPRDQPTKAARRAAGHLHHGEPVFFVCDEEKRDEENLEGLLFFGRAGMFRFPYDKSPKELLQAKDDGGLDLAEALFGRVGDDGLGAVRSRVRFEDAIATGNPPGGQWLEPTMVPAVLSSPKVTAFQHYLTQDGAADKRDLTTYIEGDGTTLRGFKLYWHRADPGLPKDARHPEPQEKLRDLTGATPKDTQCTVIRPVKAGVRFAGRVHFDNLTKRELGALLSALRLPETAAHKIGMGKPLGFGSVRVTATLQRVVRAERYRAWETNGALDDDGASYVGAFVEEMVKHADVAGETRIEGKTGLASIARIDALYTLLEWEKRPSSSETRPMRIEGGDPARFRADDRGKVNEFKDRPVLPTPQRVARRPEPRWRGETPKAGAQVARPEAQTPKTAGSAAQHRPAPHRPAPPPAVQSGPPVGSRVTVVVLAERTKKGGPRFEVLGTRWKGVLHPTSAMPTDLTPGTRLELVVMSGGAELGLKYLAK